MTKTRDNTHVSIVKSVSSRIKYNLSLPPTLQTNGDYLLNWENRVCCGSGHDNATLSMVILIVPSVSVELMILMSDVDEPIGVVSPTIALPFCEMLNLFSISPIDTLNPNGNSM